MEATYKGLCVETSLYDDKGNSYPAIGVKTQDGNVFIFVKRQGVYFSGDKYKKYIGSKIIVRGMIYAHNGRTIDLNFLDWRDAKNGIGNYVGVLGWEKRLNERNDSDDFMIIRVTQIVRDE